MLEKLRETFHNGYDDLKEIINNPIVVEAVINEVEKTYIDIKGHDKMEKAVQIALGLIQVPAYISILASDKIVTIIENVLQKTFDGLKEQNKI